MKAKHCLAWCYSLILACRKVRQEDLDFEANLDYTEGQSQTKETSYELL